nr:MAG TPA: hypothetical protein [Caudoviricetes sp.]
MVYIVSGHVSRCAELTHKKNSLEGVLSSRLFSLFVYVVRRIRLIVAER